MAIYVITIVGEDQQPIATIPIDQNGTYAGSTNAEGKVGVSSSNGISITPNKSGDQDYNPDYETPFPVVITGDVSIVLRRK